MNTKKARSILGLTCKYTEKDLKKAYYSLSLQYHPDKNPEGEEVFKEINEAYTFLNNETDSNTIEDYNSMMTEYMEYLFDIDADTFHFVQNGINKSYQFSLDTVQKFDQQLLSKLRKFINIPSMFSSNQINKPIYTLKPSLNSVLNKEIFVLEVKKETYFIPLWHDILEYDDFEVHIYPQTDSHIQINDDKNITLDIHFFLHELFLNKKKTVHITDEYTCEINTEELLLKQEQTYLIHGKGIPLHIKCNHTNDVHNDNSIYNVENYSTIILNIRISE